MSESGSNPSVTAALPSLDQFPKELTNFAFGKVESFVTLFCRPIEATGAPASPSHSGLQVALALEGMQQRIERAGTDSISVASQLLHHPLPIEFPLHRVVQDMQPDQAGQKFLVLVVTSSQDAYLYRIS